LLKWQYFGRRAKPSNLFGSQASEDSERVDLSFGSTGFDTSHLPSTPTAMITTPINTNTAMLTHTLEWTSSYSHSFEVALAAAQGYFRVLDE
jgi:hypothetical protein